MRLAHYPLIYDHGWQIDFPALEEAITPRTRGIIVVNPNNPTGHFVKPEELTALNEICSTRDMALIADEVFLDFAHGERFQRTPGPWQGAAPADGERQRSPPSLARTAARLRLR